MIMANESPVGCLESPIGCFVFRDGERGTQAFRCVDLGGVREGKGVVVGASIRLEGARGTHEVVWVSGAWAREKQG